MLKLASSLALAAATLSASVAAADVNLYSYRQPFLVQPLFDEFTEATGIPVNVVFLNKGAVERIEAEGANSPADLLFTVDIGRLVGAVDAGVTQAVASEMLEANIPAAYRDPEGHWFGLTNRARIVYASREGVADGEVTTYEDLADPKWEGRICTRSGSHAYSVALIAAMIAHHGEQEAQKWLAGVKANLARRPQGNDRAQVKAIWAGQCDIALGNNYYMGAMLADDEQKEWADSVRIVFPVMEEGGAHMNIAGVALLKHAPNRDEAVRLMEYLSSDAAQAMYAEQNFEYPVKPGVARSALVESWGDFEADDTPLAEIARLRPLALKLVDRVGFDD